MNEPSRLQYRTNQIASAYRNPAAVTPRIIAGRGHAADPARLRLLPAIGPNAPGAIPQTRPDHHPRILHHGRTKSVGTL